jgi:rhodanese-related sulfurtransferase
MFFLKTDGRARSLRPSEYSKRFSEKAEAHTLIDLRTADEYQQGHIAGAANIPLESLVARLNEISRERPVIVYCRSGSRSTMAVSILSNAGYTEVYDLGSYMSWVAQGYPTTTQPASSSPIQQS